MKDINDKVLKIEKNMEKMVKVIALRDGEKMEKNQGENT